jgi:predicted TIM-barrel fold metal-dependent hydrolase
MDIVANAGERVVDADSHVLEPPDLWQRYLEPKYRDRAIRIERGENGERLVIGESTVLEGMLAGLGGAHLPRASLFGPGMTYLDGCPPGSFDVDGRIALYDAWGVDTGIVFPTICILPFPTTDRGLANAYCRAYNTWQMEYSQALRGRIAPIAVVNWHDVDEAARELDRCFAAGFRGLFVPPETVGGRAPGDPHFDPLWARCNEAGLPGCLHVIVRFSGAAVAFRPWHDTKPGSTFTFAMGGTGQLMPAVASIVLSGLFDRMPTLKVVSVEAGCGYAAYLMDRLDQKHRVFGFAQALKLKPSDYFRRNLWFVAEPEERTIGAMLDLVGEDRILWGSDFPHVDATMDAARFVSDAVAALPPARRARVLGGNAVDLFGL